MPKKTLVVGVGSSILKDSGVGLEVAREVSRRISRPDVHVIETNAGGLSVVDKINGYERVIIVDGMKSDDGKPGSVSRLSPEDCGATTHLSTPHTLDFATALAVAEKYGYDVPESIEILGIEVEDSTSFQEGCTPVVREAALRVAAEIVERLGHVQ